MTSKFVDETRLVKAANPDAYLWVLSRWSDYVAALTRRSVFSGFYFNTGYLEDVSDDTITVYQMGFAKECLIRRLDVLNEVCGEIFGPDYRISVIGSTEIQQANEACHELEISGCG